MAPNRPVRPPAAPRAVEPGFIGPVSPLVNPPTLPATPAPLTADQQALADLMLVQGPASQPQQPPPAGGTEDLMAWMQDETPTGQPVTLPSGTTVRTDLVLLGNGLTGETTTVTLPDGSPTVVSTPGVAISPEQMAGLFATDAAYTPADRDRDLALLNGPRVQGPYTPFGLAAEELARQAATARLEAHWDQSALPAFADGSIVMPGLGYSAVQLANDLSLASTTGNLDERSTRLRSDAQQRLEKNAYSKQKQDDDQIAAQIHYLPLDDPKIEALLDKGLSPAQAQNAIFQESLDARSRLARAQIELLTPQQAKQLENTPRLYAADPNNPLTPVDTSDEPTFGEYLKQARTEQGFHNLVGDLTGLNDLTEGIEDGNWGQAVWGGTMTALTFVPGVGTLIGRAAGRGIRKVGTGIANWAEKGLEAAPKALTAAEAEVAAQATIGLSQFPTRALPGAAGLFPNAPTPFLADGAAVGSRPSILDYPKPEELPWHNPGIQAPVAVTPPHTIPPVRGPGLLSNPSARFDESGLPIGMLEDPIIYMGGPKPGRPGDIIPRRSPGQHGNGGGEPKAPGLKKPSGNPESRTKSYVDDQMSLYDRTNRAKGRRQTLSGGAAEEIDSQRSVIELERERLESLKSSEANLYDQLKIQQVADALGIELVVGGRPPKGVEGLIKRRDLPRILEALEKSGASVADRELIENSVEARIDSYNVLYGEKAELGMIGGRDALPAEAKKNILIGGERPPARKPGDPKPDERDRVDIAAADMSDPNNLTLYIIEAKGGDPGVLKMGRRKVVIDGEEKWVGQGTKEYLDDILAKDPDLAAKLNTPEYAALAAALREGRANVVYKVRKTDTNGNVWEWDAALDPDTKYRIPARAAASPLGFRPVAFPIPLARPVHQVAESPGGGVGSQFDGLVKPAADFLGGLSMLALPALVSIPVLTQSLFQPKPVDESLNVTITTRPDTSAWSPEDLRVWGTAAHL